MKSLFIRFFVILFISFLCTLYNRTDFYPGASSWNAYGNEETLKAQGETTLSGEGSSKPGASSGLITLINQDNEPVVLDSLIGKPLVMSFIYSRCPMPEMCPLIMKRIVEVQKGLNKRYKDKVFFAIITFDPEYDTPEILKEYGNSYNVDYSNLIFLTGKKEDIDYTLNHFRIYYKEEAPGTISHTMETLVMDETGMVKRIFPTSIWNPKDVISEVEKIIVRPETSAKK